MASSRCTTRYADEFPREARDGSYEDRIKQTYPIHPELFDRLYEDWSSLERFQRTRGVLRLMNTVIHALWVGEDQSPLIMPASIPIGTAAVNSERPILLHPIVGARGDAMNAFYGFGARPDESPQDDLVPMKTVVEQASSVISPGLSVPLHR